MPCTERDNKQLAVLDPTRQQLKPWRGLAFAATNKRHIAVYQFRIAFNVAMEVAGPPTTWSEEELAAGRAAYPQDGSYTLDFSKYNPTPGMLMIFRHLMPTCFPLHPSTIFTPPPPRCPCNCTTGTGRTGFIPVGPNNYPFYSTDEIYKPVLQSDGGQLSGGRDRLNYIVFAPIVVCN